MANQKADMFHLEGKNSAYSVFITQKLIHRYAEYVQNTLLAFL